MVPGAEVAPTERDERPVWQLAYYAPLEETKGIKIFCDAIEQLPRTVLDRPGFEVSPACEKALSLYLLIVRNVGCYFMCPHGPSPHYHGQVFILGEEGKIDQKLSLPWIRDRTATWSWKTHVLPSPTK